MLRTSQFSPSLSPTIWNQLLTGMPFCKNELRNRNFVKAKFTCSFVFFILGNLILNNSERFISVHILNNWLMYHFFQVWHWCLPNGQKFSFLCPNGTVFNQYARVCDWWFNVDCAIVQNYYNINEDLYRVPSSNQK